MMDCPNVVRELVERFERNIESYKAGAYNETQVRREFIDPFFEALGWDVSNRNGYAEAYKEVIHEFSQKTADSVEAPDYGFRIGGAIKFFVEAKKPYVNLKDDIHPAFQLKRYAWSAKLPLSILTDFEELAVYDCRALPRKTDKASSGRILYLNYKEYINKWPDIYSIFSPESIRKGSFDKYAASNKNKRGTAEVDDTFLEMLKEWREVFARNIALRNADLTTRELNFAVQKTIDRIIFLRICEDRGIEEYGQLLALSNGVNIYKRMLQLFKRADEKYNSGLFHFDIEKEREEAPDELTTSLIIDDKVLKEVLNKLYYPESPFEFSVLPADILGQVYEQFLGKVIRLTDGHRAVIEDKPEVKKAGGVYYTPTYIVEYIVDTTLGKLLEEKANPKEVSLLKVVDPACGSGSFLIVAYQRLLDWHLTYYCSNELRIKDAEKKNIIYNNGNGYKLSTKERKRILVNNIFGVDIDSQAVEVTKLSLLLKVLEGEKESTLKSQISLFRDRALPDLGSNIKCGNSLIGPDFFDQLEMAFLSDDEKFNINVFDWGAEFKEILNSGGFDVVIGNPPYVRQELIGGFKEYFELKYKVFHGVADLYSYFIEKAVGLLKPDGYFSYIVANKWMRANYGKPLRTWMKDAGLTAIIDFGDLPVFKGATTYPSIIKIQKGRKDVPVEVSLVKHLKFLNLKEYINEVKFNVNTASFSDDGWTLINDSKRSLVDKLMNSGIKLEKYVEGKIFRGVLTGLNKAFVIDEETKNKLIAEDPHSAEIIKPFLLGRDIKRYEVVKPNKYLIFTRRGIDIKKYPAIENYLRQYKDNLMPKPRDWRGKEWKGRKPGSYKWYEIQDAVDYYEEFEKPKIVYPEIALQGQFTYDDTYTYGETTIYLISSDSMYLLGLLNSKLFAFLFTQVSSSIRGGYLRWKKQYIKEMPILVSDEDSLKAVEQNVLKIMELKKRIGQAKLSEEISRLIREIQHHNKKIDLLFYNIYNLNEEDIKIIEEEL